jgi:hypothetical protein
VRAQSIHTIVWPWNQESTSARETLLRVWGRLTGSFSTSLTQSLLVRVPDLWSQGFIVSRERFGDVCQVQGCAWSWRNSSSVASMLSRILGSSLSALAFTDGDESPDRIADPNRLCRCLQMDR